MKFSSLARRWVAWAGVTALCAASLVACGGATSQLDPFVPARLVVFGDETSALLDTAGSRNGLHYGINPVDTTTGLMACNVSSAKVWTHRLADHYGFVFDECNPEIVQPKAFMKAKFGAKVATLEGAINAFSGTLDGSLGTNDLVTITIGVHDVVEVFSDPSYTSDGSKSDEMFKRGKLYAAQVNRLMDMNVKVLASQVIDVGLTPWAKAEGSTSAALLTTLSKAFNEGFRTDLINDGRRVGLLAFNDTVTALMRNTAYEHYTLACDEAHTDDVSLDDANGDGYFDGGANLLTCNVNTLTADNALTNYLWADKLHVNASVVQAQFGSRAINLARTLPFQN